MIAHRAAAHHCFLVGHIAYTIIVQLSAQVSSYPVCRCFDRVERKYCGLRLCIAQYVIYSPLLR